VTGHERVCANTDPPRRIPTPSELIFRAHWAIRSTRLYWHIRRPLERTWHRHGWHVYRYAPLGQWECEWCGARLPAEPFNAKYLRQLRPGVQKGRARIRRGGAP
jgi:hypothetical protein